MIDDLSIAMRPVRRDGHTADFEIPLGWEQGKGAFGGLVVGALVNTALACEDDPARRFRSVSAEIVGPVQTGRPARTTVEVLRRGTGLTALDVKLSQEGEGVLARATVTLAKTRTDDFAFGPASPPVVPNFEQAFVAPVAPPLGPVFGQHLEFRPTGALPFSGSKTASCEGFISAKTCSEWGPAEWVALADAYWPTVLAMCSAPRPTSTVGFTLHLLREPPRAPLFVRAQAIGSKDGYFTEVRELFTQSGELVLVNTQLFAIVK